MSYRRTHTAGVGHSWRWALGGKMAINPFAQRLCRKVRAGYQLSNFIQHG